MIAINRENLDDDSASAELPQPTRITSPNLDMTREIAPVVLGRKPGFRVPLPSRRKSKSVFSTWSSHFDLYLSGFIVALFLLQVMLVPQQLFPIRTPLRIALFACSLTMLLIVPGRLRIVPITGLASLIVGVFLLGLLHPTTNSIVAAMAAIGLNFAIISPVFWVPKLRLNAKHFYSTIVLLWLFNAASAAVGILEVYDPARFARESQIVKANSGEAMAQGLTITLSDGTSVFRPMGLTDTPGGAAGSGYLAILFASGLLVMRTPVWLKAVLIASVAGSVFCIFICQVRSILILTVICEFLLCVVLFCRGRVASASILAASMALAGCAAATWAMTVGGEAVWNRVATLFEASASEVYYKNRGGFLEHTFVELLPEYPLGAGLGRWGMTHLYFGDKSSNAPPSIWVEIQPTGWLLDGGLPLMILYYFAIFFCTWDALKCAIQRHGVVADLASIVLVLNIAILANTFSYVPFIGQLGLTFWILNGALMAVRLSESPQTTRFRIVPNRFRRFSQLATRLKLPNPRSLGR